MTYKYREHVDRVKAWIHPAAQVLSSEQLVVLLEETLVALWARARSTISSVMLKAVLDRVIFTVSETYPTLSLLKITETGIDFEAFRKSGNTLSRDQMRGALQLMVVEVIAILGVLTNEVLTPALYSELSNVNLEVKLKTTPRTNGDNHD